MATTFNEEYQKALNERGMALLGIRGAVQMADDADARRKDLETILFGDDANYGIVSVLSVMYRQVWLLTGRATSKPLLHDFSQAKDQYQTNFALSITSAGDGIGGLHPPQLDNLAAGQDDVDPDSDWLTNYSLESEPSGAGVIPSFNSLLDVIGYSASNTADNRGPYLTEAEAQSQADQDSGHGILGDRTKNTEVYFMGVDPDIQWFIGQGGVDSPDNFTKKTDLLTAISDVQNKLNDLFPAFQTESDLLNGDKGFILQEFKVDLVNDPDLISLPTQVQIYIDSLQEFVDYFNQINDPSPSVNRSEINAKLLELQGYASTVISYIDDRVSAITGNMLGDTSSWLRKHLSFWVTEVVKKPDGPYAMLLASKDMLNQAIVDLYAKDIRLNFFTTDLNKWIETPTIQSIFDQAVMELDQKTVKRWETNIIWSMVMPANKYRLLMKPFSQMALPLDNTFWEEDAEELTWITDKLPTSFLRNSQIITPPAETVFFRVIAYDTGQGNSGDFNRADFLDTNSSQSDIISNLVTFIQMADTEDNKSVIEVNASEGLKERDFLMINGSQIGQIMAISDDQYVLDMDYGQIVQVQKLFGLYFKESVSA